MFMLAMPFPGIPWWWPMLATATADPSLSGQWVLELVTKIFAGLAVLIGAAWAAYRKGQACPSSETTIKPTPFPVTQVNPPHPSWEQHRELVRRVESVEKHLERMREDQGRVFAQILESGTERENRLSEKMDSQARAIHKRIDELLMALGVKPNSRK